MTGWLKKNKKVLLGIAILAVMICVCGILYTIFNRHLIGELRYLQATGLLDKIIASHGPEAIERYIVSQQKEFIIYLSFITLFLAVFFASFAVASIIKNPSRMRSFHKHTDSIDALPQARIGIWIALAAGLGLFAELMLIRLHASYFQLFAYFKNVSLLSCFLGLGIGYAMGNRRPLATPLVLPLMIFQIVFLHALRFSPLDKFLHNPITEQITLGLNQAQTLSSIAAYMFLILIFVINAMCFIPLGHLASYLMKRRANLVAYSWNLIGSLAGIILFTLLSFLWTPPVVWIILAAAMVLIFLYKNISHFIISTGLTVAAIIFLLLPLNINQFDVYSPYQILTLVINKKVPPILKTSNTYYQRILDLSQENLKEGTTAHRWSHYYNLPYTFKPAPQDVLVVGSGTGNDVSAALRHGGQRIDAVEIDPAIILFGKKLHPENPYQAKNVNIIIDDARNFIRYTKKNYDLIVYGLLDSHVLLSGKSGGIRLDSYVYTLEAFQQARTKLKKDGMISLSFCVLDKNLGRKLYLMLKKTFDGTPPRVYQTGYDNGYMFLASDNIDTYPSGLSPVLHDVTARFADSALGADMSTDDWPFFYMPVRRYPFSYVIVIALMLFSSIVAINRFLPTTGKGFSLPCFFLGAGFMLIETKGITELALVYGTTWIIISVIIAAILILGFLANLFVIKKGTPKAGIVYTLLFLSVFAGLWVSCHDLSFLSPALCKIVRTFALTIPLFFSGFAFSSELKKTASVGIALSSNLLGAMLGGFFEYNSMYFGFRSLYLLAFVFYVFALLGSLQAQRKLSH